MSFTIPRRLITNEISRIISQYLTFEQFSGYQNINYDIIDNIPVGETLVPLHMGRYLNELYKWNLPE